MLKLTRGELAAVPLRVAASLLYFQGSRQARNDEQLDRALERAAFAIAQLVPIYYQLSDQTSGRVPDAELVLGKFEDGAKRFRAGDGTTYESLSVVRRDLIGALDLLLKQAFNASADGEPWIAEPARSGEPDSGRKDS